MLPTQGFIFKALLLGGAFGYVMGAAFPWTWGWLAALVGGWCLGIMLFKGSA